jgi:hypothetical protein
MGTRTVMGYPNRYPIGVPAERSVSPRMRTELNELAFTPRAIHSARATYNKMTDFTPIMTSRCKRFESLRSHHHFEGTSVQLQMKYATKSRDLRDKLQPVMKADKLKTTSTASESASSPNATQASTQVQAVSSCAMTNEAKTADYISFTPISKPSACAEQDEACSPGGLDAPFEVSSPPPHIRSDKKKVDTIEPRANFGDQVRLRVTTQRFIDELGRMSRKEYYESGDRREAREVLKAIRPAGSSTGFRQQKSADRALASPRKEELALTPRSYPDWWGWPSPSGDMLDHL